MSSNEAISEFFSLPRQCVRKKTAKDSAENFTYYIDNGFCVPQHFAKGYDLVFQQFRLIVIPKLYCLLITHLKG